MTFGIRELDHPKEQKPPAVSIATPTSKLEVSAWTCVCGALLLLSLYPGFVPYLSNDAFQYLSVAQNALSGHFGYTSLIHYDAERSFGVTPAPMVHFPLGYPFAIALLSMAGLSLQKAALLVSVVSTMACVPLLVWIASQFRLSPLLRNTVVGAFVFNALIIRFADSILSEALFTFFILLGVALLLAARLFADTRLPWRWAAAGLAFGAGYWVRYAGLFFVLALGVLVVRHVLTRDRLAARGYVIAVSVAGAAVLVGIVRNILLIGHWQGTLETKVSNPLLFLIFETVRAGKVLFLGPSFDMPAWTSVLRALFIVLLFGGIAWLTLWRLRNGAGQAEGAPSPGIDGVDLLILVLVYSSCMFYTGLVSAISYDARMFLPLTPLFLLLGGLLLRTIIPPPSQRSIPGRLALFGLGASFCCYLTLNLAMIVRPPTDDSLSSVATVLDSTEGSAKSARAAILELVDPAGIIIANDGQDIGYVLARTTISLAGPSYSTVEWNEKTIRKLVAQYNAGAIVICVHDIFMPSSFVRLLAQGQAPSWMKLVYRSSDFLVYQPVSRSAKSDQSTVPASPVAAKQ